MVKVSSSLYRQLMQIKKSAAVDMQNVGAVLAYANKHGLNEAWRAILGSPKRYLLCINEGMEVSDSQVRGLSRQRSLIKLQAILKSNRPGVSH